MTENVTENKEVRPSQDIKIKMPVGQWNTVIGVLHKVPFTEPIRVLKAITTQTEGKKFESMTDELEITMTVDDFNIVLIVVKLLPFFESFDIVNHIMSQGMEQIKAQAEAAPEKK